MVKCLPQKFVTGCYLPAMSDALDALIKTLTLAPLGDRRWQGQGSTNDGADGTYGGHYLGQAVAALLADNDDDRELHSLHAYFLRSGKPEQAYEYTVERVREGRSFSNRRVQCWQQDKLIFEMTASLMVPEAGVCMNASLPADFATLPTPESLARYGEVMRSLDPLPLPAAWALREHGIDLRPINAPWCERGVSAAGGIRHWIRAAGALLGDARMHTALLAYQSDESISDNILIPFGVNWGAPGLNFVSLDHAMWFHQPVDLNDWLFVEQWPVRAGGGRGLAHARVWNRAGELVTSFAQEALLRIAP